MRSFGRKLCFASFTPHSLVVRRIKSWRKVMTSESSEDTTLPEGVKGWSWGALFLNWIWAIGNKTWIGLLCLVPYLGFIMAIVLAFKGREWAWKNKEWESVEHFNRVQRKWSIAGFIFVIVMGVFMAVSLQAYNDYIEKAKAYETSHDTQ